MKKDEVVNYALAEFGVELDPHRPLKELRSEVKTFEAKRKSPGEKKSSQSLKDVKYLKHPTNGRVFPSTPHLLSRGDMLPCDKSGKRVRVVEDEETAEDGE
jgi:hypothetical protein